MAVNQLVNASRILAIQGIADDTPGHISVRDPLSPDTAFLVTGGTKTPAQVTPADIAVARINDSVITSAALSGYDAPARPAEIFIHSSIYERFPNTTVNSIAFYRAEQLLPWSLFSTNTSSDVTSDTATTDLTGFYATTSGTAFMGPHPAPVFDVFLSDPNTTSTAVDNTIKGFALAQKFGPSGAAVQTVNETDGIRPLVLMRNDGATVVGLTVPEVVFRYVQAARSARVQSHLASMTTANTSSPQFLPAEATKTTDQYLPSWLLWMSQIEPSINADSARSPELWKGTGDSASSDGSSDNSHKNAAATRSIASPTSIVAIALAWVLVPLIQM